MLTQVNTLLNQTRHSATNVSKTGAPGEASQRSGTSSQQQHTVTSASRLDVIIEDEVDETEIHNLRAGRDQSTIDQFKSMKNN